MHTVFTSMDRVLSAMPLFAMAFLLAFGARWLFQKTTSYCIDDELTERDNPAFGVAFAGYMVGVAIALSGALYAWEGVSLFEELLTIGLFGVAAAGLMRLSLWINDRAILHSFPIEKELVEDRNAGTGFVVAGSSIATGFMLRGVLNGFSSSVWMGLRDVAIYFLVGQAILVAGGWVYTKFAGYDVHEEIGAKDNVAAGVSFGGYLAALGYIASVALTGATSDWMDEVATSLVLAFFGVVLLITARTVADLFLLPKSPLAKEVAVDRNKAAGAVAAASFLLVAVLFGASVQPDRTLHSVAVTAPSTEEPIDGATAPEEAEPRDTDDGAGGAQ
ncbi:MAG: DUF350 domain-containing protein [Bryobacterales bacterium]|nr:DUF350 domain-containing protein [Bryobacterales bacterium]